MANATLNPHSEMSKIAKLSPIAFVAILIGAMSVSSASPLIIRYEYDAAGNRISRSVVVEAVPSMAKKMADMPISSADSGAVKVYPNPTHGIVNVELTTQTNECNEATVEIHDMEGRLVLTRVMPAPHFQIDISNFPTGIYILKIKNSATSNQQRIVKL